MSDRLSYLESGFKPEKPKKSETDSEQSAAIRYPTLARYDFAGNGPRAGIELDHHLFKQASRLETRGERAKPYIIKVGWILIRLAVGLLFVYFVLYGHSFDCMGAQYVFG